MHILFKGQPYMSPSLTKHNGLGDWWLRGKTEGQRRGAEGGAEAEGNTWKKVQTNRPHSIGDRVGAVGMMTAQCALVASVRMAHALGVPRHGAARL